MLSGLGNIVVKEIKELIRDPKILVGMIIIPLIMFPLMGLAIRTSQELAMESVKQIPVAVADFDNATYSRFLVGNLTVFPNLIVMEVDTVNVSDAIRAMESVNATHLIVIPSGFSENITLNLGASLDVYSVFVVQGITEAATSSVLIEALEFVKRRWSPDPFETVSKSIVKGKPYNVNPDALFSIVFSQYFVMPITIMMLLVFAMHIAATSVASEKEEKTLETLLSLPINRFTILAGKLTGSVLVAMVGALAYMIGFNFYMGSFMFGYSEQAGIDLAQVGLAISPFAYLLIGVSLFVSLLSALALAVVLSAFAEDVRGAQALVSYIYPFLFIPMLILMFTDINALPFALKVALLAIPYSHPVIAARSALTENYFMAGLGILYVTVFTVVILYVAAKLFSTEKILTVKVKLKLRRFRKKGFPSENKT